MKLNLSPQQALPNGRKDGGHSIAGKKGNGRLSQRYFISASNYSARRSHRAIFYLFRDRAELEKSIENGLVQAKSPSDFIASDSPKLSPSLLANGVAAFGPRYFYHMRDGFAESSGRGFPVSLSKSDFLIIPAGGLSDTGAIEKAGAKALSFKEAAFELLGMVRGVSFFRKNMGMMLGPIIPSRRYLDSVSWAICTAVSRTEAFAKSVFARVSRLVSDSFQTPHDFGGKQD